MKKFLVALLLAGCLLPASYAADKTNQMPPPKQSFDSGGETLPPLRTAGILVLDENIEDLL